MPWHWHQEYRLSLCTVQLPTTMIPKVPGAGPIFICVVIRVRHLHASCDQHIVNATVQLHILRTNSVCGNGDANLSQNTKPDTLL